MANTGKFAGWTFLFTFFGFVLILAGTAMDSWTNTGRTYGNLPFDTSSITFSTALNGLTPSFGTLAGYYTGRDGFAYRGPCPVKTTKNNHTKVASKGEDLNTISSGMIAVLLLSVSTGFIATLMTIMGSTGSSVVESLAPAKPAVIASIIFSIVPWALWLRAQRNDLHDTGKGSCRFEGFETNSSNVAGSFGLFVVSTGLYIILLVLLSRPTTKPQVLVLVASAAFAGLFVGAASNKWSHSTDRTFEIDTEKQYEIYAQQAYQDTYNPADDSKGNAFVTFELQFGVYTAFEYFQVNLPYSDPQNRALMCVENTEYDAAGDALVSGGRVTLGFAIAATIISFFGTVLLDADRPKQSFWLCVVALCCCVVSLLVWGIVSDPIIRDRCCTGVLCSLGSSFGLVSAGALFLLISIFYQAWVLTDDIFVLHPPSSSYGVTAKAVNQGTELRTF